jgi:hypothetical protein
MRKIDYFRFGTKVQVSDMVEVHEILCNIPFEITTGFDNELRTTRHPVIESMISELATSIENEESKE